MNKGNRTTTLDDFDSGLSGVDFKWIVPGEVLSMKFFGGFVGTGYNEAQNKVTPIIGCFVAKTV